MVGGHSERRETWGHSMIFDPWGTVLYCVEAGERYAIAQIDMDTLENVRKMMPIAAQAKPIGPIDLLALTATGLLQEFP